MPSKTAARSGARSSRSKAGSRSGTRSSRPAPRRKPAKRRSASRIPATGLAIGRGARAGWLMVARGAGSTARSVGRARDIDPGHRRDGIALALLGIAVIVVASSWFDAARPVGGWIDDFLRVLIGSAVLLLPLALIAIAVVLMRTEPDPDARPRLILGAAMIALPAMGLWHLWSGSPDTPPGRQHAAGFIGFAIGGPLSEGLTQWIAAPLLFIGALFGLLLVTGTTIREVPETVRAMFGTRMLREYEQFYDDGQPEHADADAEDFSDGYYDDPSAYSDDEAQAWPTGAAGRDFNGATPLDNYPLDDEAPTIPEPTRATRRKKAKPANRYPTASSRARTRCRRWICSRRATRRSGAVHPTTAWPRRSPRCCNSSRSTPRSPDAPAARRSPDTRSSWGPASRSRRSPSCRRTSRMRWPPRVFGCSRRFPASPPSASRCPTPTARWCGSPTC